MTWSYIINTAKKKMTIYKNNDWSFHQNSIKIPHFYCKKRSRFIFWHLTLKKSLKRFYTKYIPDDHKHNSLITTVAYPVDNYMFKANNKNPRTRCEIRSKLTIKTAEQRQWHGSGVFIVNFEHILHLVLVFLLLTLSK